MPHRQHNTIWYSMHMLWCLISDSLYMYMAAVSLSTLEKAAPGAQPTCMTGKETSRERKHIIPALAHLPGMQCKGLGFCTPHMPLSKDSYRRCMRTTASAAAEHPQVTCTAKAQAACWHTLRRTAARGSGRLALLLLHGLLGLRRTTQTAATLSVGRRRNVTCSLSY